MTASRRNTPLSNASLPELGTHVDRPRSDRLVFTITEGGYLLHEGTGEFAYDPAILRDVARLDVPSASLG